VRIRLLGPLDVEGGARLEPRDRIALSVLAVRHGEVVSPDALADALWGESLPATWQKQVQICVARLRKALGASAIETAPGGYRLAPDGEDLDTVRFERLAERGRALAATGDAIRAASAFTRALSLWRGQPLEELDGWQPGKSEAARLDELRKTIGEDLLEHAWRRASTGGWRSTPRHWSPRSRGGSGGGRSWLSRAIGAGAKPTRWSRSESRAGRSSTGSVSTRVRSLLRLSWRSCARIPRSPRRRSRRASASRARTRASCRTSRATRRTSSAGTPTSPHASSGYARARCSS
jgi:hypothetical protein